MSKICIIIGSILFLSGSVDSLPICANLKDILQGQIAQVNMLQSRAATIRTKFATLTLDEIRAAKKRAHPEYVPGQVDVSARKSKVQIDEAIKQFDSYDSESMCNRVASTLRKDIAHFEELLGKLEAVYKKIRP